MIKVIIADDHKIVVDGISSILSKENDIEVIGTVSNGKAALNLIESEQVDIAIIDINMPEMDGMQVLQEMRANKLSTRVLILSMFNEIDLIDQLLEEEGNGYMLKNKGEEELVTAIRMIYSGNTYLGPDVMATIIKSRQDQVRASTEVEPHLTSREIEVLKLIAQELTSKEIGQELSISEKTVNTHRRNLISKLEVRNSVGLARYAIQNGWME